MTGMTVVTSREPRRAADRHRPPRGERRAARAHARGLPPGHRAGRRLRRARPRLDEGRRPRLPARERDLRHDRRGPPARVRVAAGHEDDRRRLRHRLVHRGLHPRGARDAAGAGAPAAPARDGLRRPVRDPDARGGPRPGGFGERQPRAEGPTVGVYPETKHPTYFEGLGLPLEKPLLEALRRHGLDRADAPVFIQSFEVGNLRRLARLTRVPLVQLIDAAGRPWDFTHGRFARTYADMVRPEGLRDIAAYARGIGVHKGLVIPRDGGGRSLPPTTLVRDAHAAGLLVHVWTLRAENSFLPAELRAGTRAFCPRRHGRRSEALPRGRGRRLLHRPPGDRRGGAGRRSAALTQTGPETTPARSGVPSNSFPGRQPGSSRARLARSRRRSVTARQRTRSFVIVRTPSCSR